MTLGWLRHPDWPAGQLRRRHLRHGVDCQPACPRRRTARGDLPMCVNKGLAGRSDLSNVRVYCSEQAHSSIDKAAITIGFGLESLRKIPVRCRLRDVRRCPQRARSRRMCKTASGPSRSWPRSARHRRPASIRLHRSRTFCERRTALAARGRALTQEPRRCSRRTHHLFHGIERADSVVVNPHKWLFTPFDLSAFYCRRMDVRPGGFLGDAGISEDDPERQRRPQSDGHRRSAGPTLSVR